MRLVGEALTLAATDLARHLACAHATALDLAVVHGKRAKPRKRSDPALEALSLRGTEHERRYVEHLAAQGLRVADLSQEGDETGPARTRAMMAEGADVIVQPQLAHDGWRGRLDVLRRVADPPSRFGAWSYEVADTKLARETRGGTVLQLLVYAHMLEEAQGVLPVRVSVVTPAADGPGFAEQIYRVDDFAAYFRLVRRRLLDQVAAGPPPLDDAVPEPVDHCDVCAWWHECDDRRRAVDHLSFVAGISRLQRSELVQHGLPTLEALGDAPSPLPFRPRRGSLSSYARVRDQARLQLAYRRTGTRVHELLPVVPAVEARAGTPSPAHGLSLLPEPSAGDVFLDLEGDPYARDGGREYLFGLVTGSATHAHWAFTDREERAGFEATVDHLVEAWQAHPGMHVYAYGAYDFSALKRLSGRYASRTEAIDGLLRARRFVDLHAVVRHTLRASVERYSIKDLEPFYDFVRATPLREAGRARHELPRTLATGDLSLLDPTLRRVIEGYNREDCLSARALRDWLESLRADAIARGATIARPPAALAEPSETLSDRLRHAAAVTAGLHEGLPPDPTSRTPDEHARFLLGHLVGYHRREDRVVWWERFRLADLTDDELLDERAALAGLELQARIFTPPNKTQSPIDRYTFAPQDTDLDPGDELLLPGTSERFGEVHAIDRAARTVDIKKPKKKPDVHPTAVFHHVHIKPKDLEDSLLRIAEDVLAHGPSPHGPYDAVRALLRRAPPRLREGTLRIRDGETSVQQAIRLVQALDRSVLAIQGPPGTGKTHTAAAMIVALVRAGKKVGVTATSHKVIDNLLDKVLEQAADTAPALAVAHVRSNADPAHPRDKTATDTLALLQSGAVQVVGATAFAFCTPAFAGTLDVLFVDEAGQMPLANVLAASPAAESLVLLGDPRQLDHPTRGAHPDDTDVSALGHVLGSDATLPESRGLFLADTWRLHPSICTFTSELFYERRLHHHAGNELQRLTGTTGFDGAGLHLVTVPHTGNQSASEEEAAAIVALADRLLTPAARFIDHAGASHPLRDEDLLVVAPYNRQVALLTQRLAPRGIRVGTVDKFQGQQAPVVLYSMTTSTPADAPRGLEFLYSLNRLNVATSRARCVAIVVCSPALLEPECASPRQMTLANGLCRFGEMSTCCEGRTMR